MTSPHDDADWGRGALRDRVPAVTQPTDLAPRVRASLLERGLIREPGRAHHLGVQRRMPWLQWTGLLAAGILLGAIGSRVAERSSGRPARVDAAGQYVLLLYGDPPDDTGAVHVAREREYGRWASSLTNATWVGGHELADVVTRLGPAPADPPSAPNVERLAGYFVIAAPSRERAAEVARTCPHLKYGGRVVVMAVAG
jgi:hypothetical protein